MLLHPGSKGWINKYFDLVEKGTFQLDIERPKSISIEHFLHLTFGHTGIIFGYPSRLLFANSLNTSKWTVEEKLKVLLLETHLFIYLLTNERTENLKHDFIDSLLKFYGKHNSYSITKIFTFFLKETPVEKLENILIKRLEIKMNLLDNKLWVSYLINTFVYLDVILFYDNLKGKKRGKISNYNDLAMNALTAISVSAFSDGAIADAEKSLFKIFLASANLPDKIKESALKQFKNGATFGDFSALVQKNWLFKRFLLDLSALTILANFLRRTSLTKMPKLMPNGRAIACPLRQSGNGPPVPVPRPCLANTINPPAPTHGKVFFPWPMPAKMVLQA